MAIVSMKSIARKTRESSKNLLLNIDIAYEKATGRKEFLLNMVRVNC